MHSFAEEGLLWWTSGLVSVCVCVFLLYWSWALYTCDSWTTTNCISTSNICRWLPHRADEMGACVCVRMVVLKVRSPHRILLNMPHLKLSLLLCRPLQIKQTLYVLVKCHVEVHSVTDVIVETPYYRHTVFVESSHIYLYSRFTVRS